MIFANPAAWTKTPPNTTGATTTSDGKDSSVGLFDDDNEEAEEDESFDVDAEIERLSQEIEQLPSQIGNSSDSVSCMEDSRVMDKSEVSLLKQSFTFGVATLIGGDKTDYDRGAHSVKDELTFLIWTYPNVI